MSLQRGLKRRRRWRNSCSSGNRCPLALPRTCVKLNAHNPTSLSPSTRKTLCSQSYKRQRLHNPPPAPATAPENPKLNQILKPQKSHTHSHTHTRTRIPDSETTSPHRTANSQETFPKLPEHSKSDLSCNTKLQNRRHGDKYKRRSLLPS